jgi:hypothetical protein
MTTVHLTETFMTLTHVRMTKVPFGFASSMGISHMLPCRLQSAAD